MIKPHMAAWSELLFSDVQWKLYEGLRMSLLSLTEKLKPLIRTFKHKPQSNVS